MSRPQTPYELLGEDGIRRLCETFYRIMDTAPEARELRAMHGRDLSDITDRLSDYLTGWMGGPPRYAEKHGGVCLTEPHAPYHIGPKVTAQWLWCMERALAETGASEELRDMLRVPFERIARAVQNRDNDDSPRNNPNIIAAG